MKIVNNSDGKPWYTQRNNELSPGSSCNVTSMVSALVSAGWPLPQGKFKQDEDNLLDFIRSSPQVQRRWDIIEPAHKTPPNQIHELLCLGTNLWIAPMAGSPVTLRWDLRLADIVKAIDGGGAVVMSGRFKDHLSGEIGHIVPVVGYQADDNGNVTHVILDDPWGDYETLYKVQRGDDVYMPVEHWMSMIRDQDKLVKFGHVIQKYRRV
ncbi:MAG: hypothetical protein Pg6C_17210 [Treponemataceae bacterium]|nr:MAG: hypothetical protein Pg6C_17210 [Treponemataceae bacterium]